MPTHLILRCTAKLLHELGPKMVQSDPGQAEPGDSWCLNLIRIEGRKCLLATHQATLYSVFVPDVNRAQLRNLPTLFLEALRKVLAADGIIPAAAPVDPGSSVITRTNSRSVLGCMNELAFECQLKIESESGLAQSNPIAVSHYLNGTLHRMKGQPYATARERLAQLTVTPPTTLGSTRGGGVLRVLRSGS